MSSSGPRWRQHFQCKTCGAESAIIAEVHYPYLPREDIQVLELLCRTESCNGRTFKTPPFVALPGDLKICQECKQPAIGSGSGIYEGGIRFSVWRCQTEGCPNQHNEIKDP
jgi:hypothetical protein